MRSPGPLAPRRIAVLGNYGNGNLGDEATLHSVLQFVAQRCPQAVMYALSERPGETRTRHGIEAVPSAVDAGDDRVGGEPTPPRRPPPGGAVGLRGRLKARLKRLPLLFAVLRVAVNTPRALREAWRYLRFCGRSWAFLRRVDLLVVAGGGQLSDHFGGLWGFPLQLFSWCLLARCAGAQVAVLNVGAGPISGRGSRVLFRWTLRLARHRSYRDERSRRLIEQIGVRDAGSVGPDLVFGWEPAVEPARESGASADRTVGVNVFPYRDWRYWPKYDPAAYADYVDKISDLALRLLGQGHRVRFFPTHLRADVRVIRDVLERLERRLAPGMREGLEVASIATVEDLAREIGRADVIVATRFHAIVIAMLLGKPVLALCNESKMSDLMVEMGQEAYSLALDALDVPTAIGRLQALQARRERVAAQLADGVERARRTLDTQLEPVFGPRAEARGAEGAPVSSRGERVTVARLDASAGHGSW